MRVTYANCFLRADDHGDVLLTDEISVAETAPGGVEVRMADETIDPDSAQAANLQLWKLAFDWFRAEGGDATVVEGVSAGDIAGTEIGLTVLLPAARGALGAAAALDGIQPSSFRTVHATGGRGNYDRIEQIQCEAARAVVRAVAGPDLECEQLVSNDPRNTVLFGKYERSRDPDWLARPKGGRAALERIAIRGADLAAVALRRSDLRPTLLVLGYNPTRAFIDRYASAEAREYRLAIYRPSVQDLRRSIWNGDRLAEPVQVRRSPGGARPERPFAGFIADHEDELAARFRVDGWELWPVVRLHLERVVERYSRYVSLAAPRMRRELERLRTDAVLVPFESPAEARLLVRVAQSLGITTFVLNNGFMGDDFQPECMTADVGLAWSEALARNYFSRRPQDRTIVTGNPRGDEPPRSVGTRRRGLGRVLVGSLSYAPPDLNCRRSDPERFLRGVLGGIEQSRRARGAEVLVKLHPADSVEQYDPVVSEFGRLSPRLQLEGDVIALFEWCDVYVTTFSTSLIEAAAMRVPVLYYRVNEQRLHPPFRGDPWLAPRTASSPDELAALLEAGAYEYGREGEGDPVAWSEQYLGPRDGQSVRRVIEAVRTETAAPRG